jgi:hypothetical protein
MRCPYCQQNIRVQGRFCPKCGQQIFGLPVQPQQPTAPPGGAAAPGPVAPPTPATPNTPPPAPYQPFGQPAPRGDYDDGLGIEVEAEPPPVTGPPLAGPTVPLGSSHPAAPDEVGKTCPYCRFPLKPGEAVITCPACKLPHHADCWTENRGCTTYGCRGGAGVVGGAASPTGHAPHPGSAPSTLSPTGGQLPSPDFLQANELMARANNALILAIIGLLCQCLPVGIVGIFMGIAVMADANRMRGRGADARGRATTAIVVGIIGVVAFIIILIITMANRSSA